MHFFNKNDKLLDLLGFLGEFLGKNRGFCMKL